MMNKIFLGIHYAIHPDAKLLDRGYSIMPLEDAKATIARTGIFRDLETIKTVNDMLEDRGWQQHGISLIGFLTKLLDEQFEQVDVQVAKANIYWKHGAKIKQK